jgi:uncharacterized protein (TIGR03083 family)
MTAVSAVTAAVRTEREAFTDLLETLTPEQWSTPSLCPGWDVQAVAAHVAWASDLSGLEALRELVRARGRPNRLVGETAVRWSQRGTAAILEQLRRNTRTDAKPMGMPWDAALLDAVVHGLDVRRPLGIPREIPAESFRRVADFAATARWPTSMLLGGGARDRIAGLRLVTEGQDWATGDGPEVRASADAVLLVLTGRQVDPTELSGPAAAALAGRLQAA